MPIEMPKGLPFSVDTWTPTSMKKRHHFLTHAHKDHSHGISTHSSYPVYSTHLTKALTLYYYPQLEESLFVTIEVGQSVVIDYPDGEFLVTALDANHCPGAVMFLFEGNFGNILHTGDCRLTPECLQSLPEKYVGKKAKGPRCQLDYVFLDCTFGRFSLKMPSKHSAIQQVINCIWKHPGISVVYLTCDLLGQEEILVNVSQTFGSKIFVDKESNPDCFHALSLTVPEVLSQDSSCRFQMFDGFPKLYERAEAKLADARAKFQSEPLIIRPSAQWYACEEPSEVRKRGKERFNEAVRDKFGVWHVCYSMHSSREELDWALQLLAPKRVASTTPSCWAMELDYVKKHCFKTQVASDDPLWKLLNIGVEAPLSADKSMEGCLPMIVTCAEPESEASDTSNQNELFNPSPPSTSPVVTLFGRARLSNQDFTYLHEENEQLSNVYDSIHTEDRKVEDTTFEKDSDTEEECEKSLKKEKAVNCTEAKCKLVEMKSESCDRASCSSIKPSKRYCENLRKMYRTMNVAVPQPLPSLVELMNANRQAKRKFTLYCDLEFPIIDSCDELQYIRGQALD